MAFAAKGDVQEEIRRDLGGDLRMSGWRRVKFDAGFDVTSDHTAVLSPRPTAPWKVLEDGRSGKEAAFPKGRRRRKVYRTPVGLRTATSERPWRSGKTRGKNTMGRATVVIARKTPERVHKHTTAVLRRHF